MLSVAAHVTFQDNPYDPTLFLRRGRVVDALQYLDLSVTESDGKYPFMT